MGKIPPSGVPGSPNITVPKDQPASPPPDPKPTSNAANTNTAASQKAQIQQAQARKSEQDVSVLSRKLQIQGSQFGSAIPPASIQQNLNSVQVGETKSKLPGLAPNSKELNELAGANTPSKRSAFKPVQSAYHQKAKLERRLENQQTRLEGQKQVVANSKQELSKASELAQAKLKILEDAKQKVANAPTQAERKAANIEAQKVKLEYNKAANMEKRAARVVANTERKQTQIEQHLEKTKSEIPVAEKKLQDASENLQKWVKDRALGHNGEIRSLNKEIRNEKAHLAQLKKARRPDEEKIKASESKLQELQTKRDDAAKRIQAGADNFKPLVAVERSNYSVNVGGRTVQLHDNVIAYAATTPKGMEGSAAGDGKAVVKTVVDRSGLSTDKKDILKGVSGHEGSFSTINTWDRAVVTAGFIQWTSGAKGNGSIVGLYRDLKSKQPELFKNNYQKYGIDVEGNELKVTKGDGTVLKGAAAAKAIQTDPKLAAVLSAAGTDPTIQDHQVAYAARTKIDAVRNRQVNVDGHTVKVGDVVSSKYGVAMMTDRAVHGGEGTVDGAVRAGIRRFLADNKDANLNDAATRARAEKYVQEELENLDTQRASSFNSFSKDAGSSQP
jgi:hypothetical protein